MYFFLVDIMISRWFLFLQRNASGSILVDPDESLQRTVVGLFLGVRKKTGRKLLAIPVIGETLAAETFPAAGLPGAIAAGGVR
jgi:hypothetical protein